jgi:Protein of unknown function (DUF3017)
MSEQPADPARVIAGRSRGGGRPARAGEARAKWWIQLPYWISLALVLAGLAWIWYGGSQRVRGGTLTLAGAMFIAAFARLVLPQTRAALLVSRRRLVDVVVLAALAVGLLITGLVLPAPV